jgi:hypothetical protein
VNYFPALIANRLDTRPEIKIPEGNAPLLSDNFNAINSVIMAYHYLYSFTEVNNNAAIVRRENANRLIELLNKENGLK